MLYPVALTLQASEAGDQCSHGVSEAPPMPLPLSLVHRRMHFVDLTFRAWSMHTLGEARKRERATCASGAARLCSGELGQEVSDSPLPLAPSQQG